MSVLTRNRHPSHVCLTLTFRKTHTLYIGGNSCSSGLYYTTASLVLRFPFVCVCVTDARNKKPFLLFLFLNVIYFLKNEEEEEEDK